MKLGEFELNKIYCMDCLEGLKKIPNNSIDLVVTDPPYNENYNYDNNYKDNKKYYYDFISDVLKECKRVIKDSGSIYFKHSSKQIDKILPILNKYFTYKMIICWTNNSQGHPHKNYDSYYEPIYFYCVDENKVIFNKRAELRQKPKGWWSTSFKDYVGLISNVWFDIKATAGGCVGKGDERSINNNYKLHPCSMPINLARRCILFSSNKNDIVLDCFMGSGTTAIASKQLERRFIGFEISPEYVKISNKRLKQQTL